MPTVNCSPFGPKPQIELSSGTPAVGYKLFFYVAGSVNTKQDTYTDSTGAVANTNPLVLNSLGQPTTEIWFTAGQGYKVVLAPSTDTDPPTSPVWSIDNLRGINDTSVSIDQWVSGPSPTFTATTQFTLAGDQTSIFHVGRRLRFTVTAGTVYGRITASTFAALTAVTMAMDGSQVLDAGLSAVSYGLLTNNVLSIPFRTATAAGTDTYTASVGATQLVTFDEYVIRITNTNATTTPTLNLDGLGAKTIKTQSGGALIAGQLNGEHLFRYNGTDMIVLNPIPFTFLTTAGDTIYATGASTPVRLGIGTAGQVNRVNAGATAPEWSNPTIQSAVITTTGAASVDSGQIIPAWATEIIITYNAISGNGTSNFMVQVGDSGGIETSAYASTCFGNATSSTSTAGFLIANSVAAANNFTGKLTLSLHNPAAFTWIASGTGHRDDLANPFTTSGVKSTSAALTQIRLTTVGGVDTFDAMSLTVSYR